MVGRDVQEDIIHPVLQHYKDVYSLNASPFLLCSYRPFFSFLNSKRINGDIRRSISAEDKVVVAERCPENPPPHPHPQA